MKLQRLIVTGFGKLVGQEYTFGAGLNVIYGPNESGKSTLQTFIRAMLYGLKAPDAKIRRWRPDRALYAPWADAPYGGAMEFMAADGRLYRVERSFQSDRTQVYDLITGDGLTSRFVMDARKELLFAEHFTGMNELVFTNTACIGDIPDAGTDKGRRELAVRLANLRESGDEATSVRRATDLLEAARRALVTQVNGATRTVNEVQAAWDEMSQHHTAIRALELDLAQLQEEKQTYQKQLDTAAVHLLGFRMAALRTQVEQARLLTERVDTLQTQATELKEWASFPIHLLDQVKTRATQLATQEERCTALYAALQASQQLVATLQAQLESLPGTLSVAVLDSDPLLFEQAKRQIERFGEVTTRAHMSAKRLVVAQSELARVEAAGQRFVALADLPPNSSQYLADLVAIQNDADASKEHLVSMQQRRKQLLRMFDQYRQQVGSVYEVLHRSEHLAGLPADHQQQFEQQVATCVQIAQHLPQLLDKLTTMQDQETILTQALQVLQRTSKQIEQPGEQAPDCLSNDLAVQQSAPQLRLVYQVCSRVQRALLRLRQLELALGTLPDLDVDSIEMMRVVERETSFWQAAEQQAARSHEELLALQEQERILDAQLDALRPVAIADSKGLAKAEHLQLEEQEARRQAASATQAAERTAVPTVKRQLLGGTLVVAGGAVAGASFWLVLPVMIPVVAVLLLVWGGYLFWQASSIRRNCSKQRTEYYQQKRAALATAERLSGQLRSMLYQVEQPSVAAWQTAWQQLTQLQTELAEGLRKQQLAAAQLQTASRQIDTARQKALNLAKRTHSELAPECTAAQATELLSHLQAQLAKQERLEHEYDTVNASIATDQEILAQEDQSLTQQLLELKQELSKLRLQKEEQLAQLQAGVQWVMGHLDRTSRHVPSGQLLLGQLPWDSPTAAAYVSEYQAYLNAGAQAADLSQQVATLHKQWRDWQAEFTLTLQRGQAVQARWQRYAAEIDALQEVPIAAVTLTSRAQHSLGAPPDAHLSEHLWPEVMHQAWYALQEANLDVCIAVLTELVAVSSAAGQRLLTQANTTSLSEFTALWQEYDQQQQLLREQRVAVKQCWVVYTDDLQQLQRLIEQHIVPLSQSVAVPTPTVSFAEVHDVASLAKGKEQWQMVISKVATRVQAVEDAYVKYRAVVQQQAMQDAQYSEHQQVLTAMQVELTSLCNQGGAQTVAEFTAAAGNYNRLQQLVDEQQAAQRELQAHLAGKTLQLCQQELATLQQEWDHRSDNDEPISAQAEPQWRAQHDQLEEQLAVLRDQQVQLETELATHMQACAKEAEVAGQLQEAQEEKSRTAKALAAVQLARQQLDAAVEEVHRQFTPALNDKASTLLAQVTGGRYQQVAVSDALEIKLTDAQYARQVALDTLSRGTGEQVYLAFRLACVQVIAGEQWCVPIILDEAFAHYDDARAQQAVDVLLQLTEQAGAQVLFFTCHSRELLYLKQRADQLERPCNIINLM